MSLKVLCSDLRRSIVLSLFQGPKRLKELEEGLKVRASSIVHALYELEEHKLVDKSNKHYALTNKGFISALLLQAFEGADSVFELAGDFLLSHDISGIPRELLVRIGELKGCQVVRSTPESLDRVHKEFLKLLSEAKEVLGVSPIFHRDFVDVVQALVGGGVPVTMVFTGEVLSNVVACADKDNLSAAVEAGLLRIFCVDELKVASVVTDKFLSLGLFKPNGEYDYSTDLIGGGEAALKWGRDLFDYYARRSKPVEARDLRV
ncbi:MAG: winged helix-turn-helix domain-containing protein [Candidatus Nezhaarchaeota archaeon]|nr:winged helix-turn-helix domain-containing protein [Candidatus Nezhaarchaeota archaeon]